MKFILIAVAVVLCCTLYLPESCALPIEDSDVIDPGFNVDVIDPDFGVDVQPQNSEVSPSRQKRATCDLLSFTGANDSVCALHCIGLRYKGGYCNGKKVCVCRK